MRSRLAFVKKEITEQIRSGKLMILGIVFVILGVMNPAVAKLTPWLLELFADSLDDSGMTITGVTVTAMDSWVQFFKNAPMGLIAFVLVECAIFTREYSSGTLVLSLTKGLERYKVVLSKSALLVALWSIGYWLCFGITYAYNAYYWDNSVAQNLALSVVCWWLFGVWCIALIVLLSTALSSGSAVLLITGGAAFAPYLIAFVPKLYKAFPNYLTEGTSLIYGLTAPDSYLPSIIITFIASLICFGVSVPIFNKKQL